MSTVLLLAFVSIVESVVYLHRYRSAVTATRWISAASTLAVTACRVVFVAAGVSAAMREVPLWVVLAAYCVPAAVATALMPHPARKEQA